MSRRAILAWSAAALLIVAVGTGAALAMLAGRTFGELLWGWAFAEASIVVSFGAVGAVLAARRSGNPVGWLSLGVAWLVATSFVGARVAEYVEATGHAPAAVTALGWFAVWGAPFGINAFGLLALLLFVFPDGRPRSRRWRPLVWLTALGCAVSGLVTFLGPIPDAYLRGRGDSSAVLQIPRHSGPLGAEFVDAVWEGVQIALLLLLLAAVVSLLLRLRGGSSTERRQVRWVVYVSAFAIALFFGGAMTGIAPVTNTIAIPAIPVAIGVAVLRYRLYDIDRLISRTVVYAVVTAVLGGLYVLVAILPATLLGLESDLLVAAATLTAAAAFGPVRGRVQYLVDRRFDRARYDARLVVERFGAQLRDQVDLEALTTAMRQTVTRTVAPAAVSVWLREVTS